MPTSPPRIQTKKPNSEDSTNTPLPHIARTLLVYLKEIHRDQVPTVGMSDREIWIEVGKISLIRHLEDIYKQQNETE